MASTESLVLAAWVTRLSIPDGTGSYTYALTPAGTVRLGSPTQTAARLSVYVQDPQYRVDVFALGKNRVHTDVVIVGHVGATGKIPGDQMKACADLWSDLKRAIYADRTLGSVVLSADITGGVLTDGDGNYYVQALGTCFFDEAT